MTSVFRTCAIAGLMLVCGGVATSSAGARTGVPATGQAQPAKPSGQISPADIQAMFDAMTVMDAERFVTLTPEQFPSFVQRLKKLQEARVLHMRRRNRAMNELRMLANPQTGKGDDAAIDAKLKELATIEAEGQVAVRNALDALDQLLSPRQRARFRILEANIELKKLDFLSKVRQPPGRGGI